METILDDFAHQNALREVDTRLKLALGVGAILIGVFSASPLAPVVIAVSMSIITVGLAKIPVRLYIGLLAIPVTFAVMSGVVILLVTGGGETLYSFSLLGFPLCVTTGSLHQAELVIARTFGGMCSLYFIALSTPMVELFSVMRSLRLPCEFVDLSMLIYRSIFVLIGEAIAIYNAQVMRNGYSTFRRKIYAFSMLSAMLFIKAWERGEALLVAMDSRCYDGKLEIPGNETRISLRGAGLVGSYLIALFAVAVFSGGLAIL
jgi:cobalt/nickel transport system permease protein